MKLAKTSLYVVLSVLFVVGCTDPKSRLSPDGLKPPGSGGQEQQKPGPEDLVLVHEELELSYPLKSARMNRVEVNGVKAYKRITKSFYFQAQQDGHVSLAQAHLATNNCEVKDEKIEIQISLSQGGSLIEEEGPSPIEVGRVYTVTVVINNEVQCDEISYGFAVLFE